MQLAWVRSRRSGRGGMAVARARVAKLDALGFVWTIAFTHTVHFN
jgi:hypothetical protein